jgi:DNA-binding response OmpR family regulator
MGKKIVLADDEQFISIAYSDGLSRAGYEVVVAHDGEEALEKIRAEHPDLILLDLMMPKVNGFDVLKAVKMDAQLQNIPVIILSNLSQQTDAEEVRRLGAVDFIVKSDISLEQLIERIQSRLSSS